MSKFFKKTFGLAIMAGLGYLGLKVYKIIKGSMKLSKNLPEFLTNVYGEKPSISINKNFRALRLKVGFSTEILEQNNDIEAIILEYIEDFYPELAKDVKLDIFDKSAKSEECDCGCEEEKKEDCDCECEDDCGEDCDCKEDEVKEEVKEEEE